LWLDLTAILSPNWLTAVAAFFISVGGVDGAWPGRLENGRSRDAAGAGGGLWYFYQKWMGGGDIKLLTVCSLWVGWLNLPEFVVIVTLLGGALSVGV